MTIGGGVRVGVLWEPAVGWVKRHRRATHHGALGTLNLNEIFSPLCFAKGDIQRSLGQRLRKALKSPYLAIGNRITEPLVSHHGVARLSCWSRIR